MHCDLLPNGSNPHNKTDLLVYRYGADPYNNWNQSTPGPLAVLINAMLGEESWFPPLTNATTVQEEHDAFVSACTRGLPLSVYTGYLRNGFASANLECSFLNLPGKLVDAAAASPEGVGDASRLVAAWFSGFTYNASTEDALEAGMYLANEALLTLTVDASKIDSARPIYATQGTTVFKPAMRTASKAIVSFLMLVEIAGFGYLLWFSYRMPTFASRFDAVQVAVIGSQLTRHNRATSVLPPLGLQAKGKAWERCLKALEEHDGLIGFQEEMELMPLSRSSVATPRASPSPYTPSPTSSVYAHVPTRPAAAAYATSTVTSSRTAEDDVISTIVSEPDDPDGPPKYGDVLQADAERAASAASAAAAMQRRWLVVGGAGKITRQMPRSSHGRRRDGNAVDGRIQTSGGQVNNRRLRGLSFEYS